MNRALDDLIAKYRPDVIALQEIAECTLDRGVVCAPLFAIPTGYRYLRCMLVDSAGHPLADKWRRVRERGQWPPQARLKQGNGFLIRDSTPVFPPTALPRAGVPYDDWEAQVLGSQHLGFSGESLTAVAHLDSGFYLGDRETEPRAAIVLHIVMNCAPVPANRNVLDVFVANVHLTRTISEGTPSTEAQRAASEIRRGQMRVLLDKLVSRYDAWRSDGYRVRGQRRAFGPKESGQRTPPLWVLLGDFNFSLGSIEHELLSSAGFVALAGANRREETPGESCSANAGAVDHVFVRSQDAAAHPDEAVTEASGWVRPCNEFDGISDHCPVLCQLRLPS